MSNDRRRRQLNKKSANIQSPHMQAILTGEYSFIDKETAINKIRFFHNSFSGSKHDLLLEEQKINNRHEKLTVSGEEGEDYCIIWIRGYELTEAETAKNYVGNFALIQIAKKDDVFTLVAKKLCSNLNRHPVKNKGNQKHPDWHHTILRSIKNGRIYDSLSMAQQQLSTLHEQFPQVTIPNGNKLFIIIYDKSKDIKKPTQKYVFQIEEAPAGHGYIISSELNTHQSKKAAYKTVNTAKNEKKARKGLFGYIDTIRRFLSLSKRD